MVNHGHSVFVIISRDTIEALAADYFFREMPKPSLQRWTMTMSMTRDKTMRLVKLRQESDILKIARCSDCYTCTESTTVLPFKFKSQRCNVVFWNL